MARPKELTKEWQVEELEKPVLPHFIQREKEVHGEFTTVDYVRLMLNYVFPGAWDFELIDSPSRLDLDVGTALYVCAGRLTVIWADGTKSVHEAPGAVKLEAGWNKKENRARTVKEANINQHVMGYIGSRSSALKSCAADMGPVFRPLSDDTVSEFVYKREQRRKVDDLKENHGIDVSEESAEKSNNDLFGEEPSTSRKAEPESAPGAKQSKPQGDGQIPRHMSEFYEMAESIRGISKADALDYLTVGLTEFARPGTTVKDALDGGMTVEELWEVLITYAP